MSLTDIILKLIWPLIKDFIKKIIIEFLEWLIEKIKEFFRNQDHKKEEKANSNADAAEEMARNAKSKEETEKHEAVAKVWREVAEMFRRENEAMQEELNNFKQEARQKAEESVDNMKFEEHFESSGKDVVAINNSPVLKLDK